MSAAGRTGDDPPAPHREAVDIAARPRPAAVSVITGPVDNAVGRRRMDCVPAIHRPNPYPSLP